MSLYIKPPLLDDIYAFVLQIPKHLFLKMASYGNTRYTYAQILAGQGYYC